MNSNGTQEKIKETLENNKDLRHLREDENYNSLAMTYPKE